MQAATLFLPMWFGSSRVSSQIDYRREVPRNVAGLGLVGRDFRTPFYEVSVECGRHVHSLRKHGSVQRVGCPVYLVHAVDAGDSDFLHREFLNLPDRFGPFFLGLGNAQRYVQQGADLVLSDYGVQFRLVESKSVLLARLEVSHHVDGDFAHLPDFLFQCHLVQPLPDVVLYFRIGRDGGSSLCLLAAGLQYSTGAYHGCQCDFSNVFHESLYVWVCFMQM